MSDRFIGLGLTEAESLALAGYFVEPLGRSDVSGGAVIRTPSGSGAGTASGVFSGAAGSYWIDVAWLNENDGASSFSLQVDGVTVDSWTGTGGGSGTGTPTTRRIAVELDGGDRITLSGKTGGLEYARVDSLTLSLRDAAPPPPPPPPPPPSGEPVIGLGLTEAESLALAGYLVEPLARSDVSGGAVIRTGNAGGTASGVFSGAAGSYSIDVVWLNENDGAASFSLAVDGVTVDSWIGTGGGPGTGTPTTRRIAVELDGGETLTLVGNTNGGKEFARIDSLTVSANEPIDPMTDAFDFFAFAGQSNAEGHFFLRSGDTPGPLGFEVFESEIGRLTGVDTTAIEAALGGSGSNERADNQKYWWDLGDDRPGPALLEAVTTIRAGMLPGRDLDGIVWAQGEDDMTRIRSRGHEVEDVVNDLKTATTKAFGYFREQFGDVPIFVQELGEFADQNAMAALRQAQRDLIDALDYVFLGAETAGLEHHDDIHFSNAAYGDIAERLAQSAVDLIAADTFA